MKYGLYDAKNSLSRLVREVAESGISVTITHRGNDIVEVVPIKRSGTMTRREAIERILAGGVGANLTRAEIDADLEEDRL